MSDQVLVQVRVDKKLKEEVVEIYESLGMDLPTAVRMFLTRSKMVRGIPFETTLPQDAMTRSAALEAFEELRRQASDVPEMTPDEINAEISAARSEQKGKS